MKMWKNLTILALILACWFRRASRCRTEERRAKRMRKRDERRPTLTQATNAAPDVQMNPVRPPIRNWRYRINPSDTLELTFSLTPEFNQTVTVQPDGYITLRDVGDLQAAGQTLPELTESIKSGLLQNPSRPCDLGRSQGFRETLLHCGRPGWETWKI